MSTPRPPDNDSELESVARLIERVFADEATIRAHLALVRASGFVPEALTAIWDANGHALSVVQAVPCKVALLRTWLDAGIITMVATDEEVRGRGHMRACVHAAHEWLLATGRPLALLYGVPEIYPRFGYRPVMPRSELRYPAPPVHAATTLRAANESDIPAITGLFNSQEINRPCSVRRNAEPWVWHSTAHSMAVMDTSDGIAAYVRYAAQDTSTLDVVEATSRPGDEPALLNGLHTLAAARNSDGVLLRLMPDHPLALEVNRRATSLELSGVELTVQPPQAGMLCVLDTVAALELLRTEITSRLRGEGLRLIVGNAESVQFGVGGPSVHVPNEADLAHLLAGYPGVPAMRQWGTLHADDRSVELAQTTFPTAWPRWTVAPFG